MVTDIKERGGEGRGGEGRGGKGREGKGQPSDIPGCPWTDITPPARLEGMVGSNKYPKQTGKPACKTNCCS